MSRIIIDESNPIWQDWMKAIEFMAYKINEGCGFWYSIQTPTQQWPPVLVKL